VLTVKRVERATAPGRYYDTGSGLHGFCLQVSRNGARSWLLRFQLDGKKARRAAVEARALWIKDMSSAWKRPARDAAEPDASVALLRRPDAPDDPNESLIRRAAVPEPDMRRHLFGVENDNAELAAKLERQRSREHAARSRDLQQAWMSPGARAAAVEAQRRRVTNEAS
jgi:hypothetical protein